MNFKKLMFLLSFSVILILSVIVTSIYIQADSINNPDAEKTETAETETLETRITEIETTTPKVTTSEITESVFTTKPKPNLETVVVSNGFTLLQSGGAYITRGAQIEFDINKPITCIKSHQLKDFLNDSNNVFKPDEIQEIKDEDYYENDRLGTLLLRKMFNLKFNDGSYNWFLESTNIQIKPEEGAQKDFLEALYNMEQDDYILKGKVSFAGTSLVEKEVYCFIAVTHVTFSDGKKIRIINNEQPYVMEMNGLSSGAKVLPESYLIYTNTN